MSRPPDPIVRHVLAVNAGSSSVKLALFDRVDPDLGATDGDGPAGSGSGRPGGDGLVERWRSQIDVESGTALDLGRAVAQIEEQDLPQPDAIGHRVVHGGPHHAAPALVDDRLRQELADLVPFAPCTSPAPWPGWTRPGAPGRADPRWPASTPPSTTPWRPRPSPWPCRLRPAGPDSAATASTA